MFNPLDSIIGFVRAAPFPALANEQPILYTDLYITGDRM
jgi:hypothetical protein